MMAKLEEKSYTKTWYPFVCGYRFHVWL